MSEASRGEEANSRPAKLGQHPSEQTSVGGEEARQEDGRAETFRAIIAAAHTLDAIGSAAAGEADDTTVGRMFSRIAQEAENASRSLRAVVPWCPACHGEGTREEGVSRDEFGNWDTREVRCDGCNGEGLAAHPARGQDA